MLNRSSSRPRSTRSTTPGLLVDLLVHEMRVAVGVVASRVGLDHRGCLVVAWRRAWTSGTRLPGPWRSRRRPGAQPGGCSGPARRRRMATNISLSPMPSSTGLPLRATTSRSGCGHRAPRGRRCRRRTSAPGAPLPPGRRTPLGRPADSRPHGPRSGGRRSRCRSREANSAPSAISLARSSSAFSMIPLCTIAIGPQTCGCALTSLGSPCVAHRVCPMPGLPLSLAGQLGGKVRRPGPWPCAPASSPPRLDDRDPGRVVTAVFQPGQPLQQDRDTVPATDIRDDSAQSACSCP